MSSCPRCQGMRVVEVAGSVYVRLLPSGHRGSRPSHPRRISSSSSATGARVRVPHKPHTGPRHNPGATSAQGLIMTLYADDKCKDSDNDKYKKKDKDKYKSPHQSQASHRATSQPLATSALGLRSRHVMTLYADDECKDRDSGKYKKNRAQDKYKSLQQAMSPPPSPFIRRTFMTTHKVLS